MWQVWTQEKSMPLSQVNNDNKALSSTHIQHDGVFYSPFEAQNHTHTCTFNIIHHKTTQHIVHSPYALSSFVHIPFHVFSFSLERRRRNKTQKFTHVLFIFHFHHPSHRSFMQSLSLFFLFTASKLTRTPIQTHSTFFCK